MQSEAVGTKSMGGFTKARLSETAKQCEKPTWTLFFGVHLEFSQPRISGFSMIMWTKKGPMSQGHSSFFGDAPEVAIIS